jgi:protein tyrosine phosphatase (PTP) superfamily phosphohydrolase (DUF442 family)
MLVLTIGHSTRPIDVFVGLLAANGVTHLMDARTIPKSRHNPQFNSDALARSLHSAGIAYTHVPGLGGRAAHAPIRPMRRGATHRFAATPITCRRRHSPSISSRSSNSQRASVSR